MDENGVLKMYCSTCLNSTRKLTPLKKLKNVLRSINWLDIEFNIDEEWFCWECKAVVMKIFQFQKQALEAQHAMTLHKDLNVPIKDLSNLSISVSSSCNLVITEDIIIKSETNDLHLATNYITEDIITDHNTFDTHNTESNDVVDSIDSEDQIIDEIKPEIDQTNEANLDYINIKTELNEENAKNKNEAKRTDIESMKLSKHERMFIIKEMSMEEMENVREMDRNLKRYKEAPFKCKSCIVSFFAHNLYMRHMEQKHGKGKGNYICEICQTRFRRKDTMQYHKTVHARRYNCPLCAFTHHKLNRMVEHHSRRHDTKQFPCKLCAKTFGLQRQLRYHNDVTHKQMPECDYCGKTCKTKCNLKIHISLHHTIGNPTVQCKVCGKFCLQTSLKSHLRTHSTVQDESAYCAECDYQYKNVNTYKSHLFTHRKHRDPGKMLSCDQCSQLFVNKVNLRRHISAVHLNHYPFACHLCEKKFVRKDKLKWHILERHEGVSPPKTKICSYCGKAFKTRTQLDNHVRTHTGERPFACERCPARFAQRTTLRTHVRGVHHARRPDAH